MVKNEKCNSTKIGFIFLTVFFLFLTGLFVFLFVNCISLYSKLDIDIIKATNDGIYSYLVKEDVMDAKKQLLGI